MFLTFSQALLDELNQVIGVTNIDLDLSSLTLYDFNETYFVIGGEHTVIFPLENFE